MRCCKIEFRGVRESGGRVKEESNEGSIVFLRDRNSSTKCFQNKLLVVEGLASGTFDSLRYE